MRLLLSGLDTVECAYYLNQVSRGAFDFADLAVKREALRNAKRRKPCLIDLAGKPFLLGRGGTGSGYPYRLENAEQTVQCGEFNKPSFFVAYRSEALWHKGARQLHAEFSQWATALGFMQYRDEGLSRVDFAFDFALPRIDFDDDSFVTLASKDSKHRKDRKAQTFRFGEGDIVLRVYDKAAEIRESSQKTWFHELWGGVSEGVWRVEFQVRKDVLKRFSLRTFADLFDGYGDLLRYLVHEHTTLRVQQDDSNRSRWPLHPLWALLQAHVATLPVQGVIREVDRDARLLEQMMRLAVSVEGYLKRAAAIETVRQGIEHEPLSHEKALAGFSAFLRRVHNPMTWHQDVSMRVDEIRAGQL